MQASQYDYIFLGAGCASLSVIMRMIKSKKLSDRKILLIDKEAKTKNDRTWCFWEKEPGFFEEIIYRKWDHLLFKNETETIPLYISPYQYKMVRGIDFYQHCFSQIEAEKNIEIMYGAVSLEKGNRTRIKVNDEILEIKKEAIIFNSIHEESKRQKGKFYLLQHFRGWVVETPAQFFNLNEAVLMDFRVSQQHGTTFVYVLPLSSTKALVEYTLFTESLLPPAEYYTALKDYLATFLNLCDYKITDDEFGVIPMTNAKFPRVENGVYYIGTAGGQTKPSTGYTFRFIQKQADSIVRELAAGKPFPNTPYFKNRFYFYDSTLLHILSKKLLSGKTIFSTLFQQNPAVNVLKFLDNETTIAEEMTLLNTLPKKIFLKAGLKEFFKMLL